MENNNPLKFDANPYHNIVLKDRKVLEITGVKQIDSFDNKEFLMETSQGWMLIEGNELVLGKLDTERGEVIIKGLIDAIRYLANKKSEKENVWGKLFK
ncbi:MAG: sporulation protein YabP [Erysipelotrichaceae bacterium]|nr:sporulation protein YabP [Erysipelotrichaceae bacterium]MBR3693969.1 sporulation protein YabP [Erysipelotrichales bacterium]